MAYTADGDLADLFPQNLDETVAFRGALRVGEMIEKEVRERTPVAEIPLAYKGSVGRWVADRKGRRPGTLKGSWKRSAPRVSRDRVSVTVFTDDKVAPFVEDDTRPHIIRPRKAKALRFPSGVTFRFAQIVHHPGTTGAHMMRDTLAVTEARWPAIVQRVIEEEASGVGR